MEDWDLLINYIKNETSAEDKKTVEAWLALNEENKILFNQVKTTWEQAGSLDQPLIINKNKAWQLIQEKIKPNSGQTTSAETKTKSYTTWWIGIAAGAAIAVFALFLFLSVPQQNELLSFKTEGSEKMIVLPDSSRVFLNKHSSLNFPKAFDSGIRKVTLIGEAYFEVKKNPEQPFIIENKNFEIKVLGTSFNVSAYENNTNSTVNVISGKVALSGKTGQSVILEKEEMGILNTASKELVKQKSNNLNFLSWKTKKLEFKNADFKEVGEKLKEYFSITLEVQNEEIFKCKFTGTFQDPTLEEVIDILEKTLSIEALITNKHIILKGKGC